MILPRTAINRKNMTAEDLFLPDAVQVFSKKTGEYLGIIISGEQLADFNEEVETIKAPEPKDENQLSMF